MVLMCSICVGQVSKCIGYDNMNHFEVSGFVVDALLYIKRIRLCHHLKEKKVSCISMMQVPLRDLPLLFILLLTFETYLALNA